MEAKLKAQQLIDKFHPFCKGDSPNGSLEQDDIDTTNNAKKCALIAIDEIEQVLFDLGIKKSATIAYWFDVKKEINRL